MNRSRPTRPDARTEILRRREIRIPLPILLLLLLASLLGAACAEENAAGDWLPPGDEEEGSAPEEETETDGEIEFGEIDPSEGLEGPWAAIFSIAFSSQLPILNTEAVMILNGVALIEVLPTDPSPQAAEMISVPFTEHICDLYLNVTGNVRFKVLFPQAAIDVIGTKWRHAIASSLAVGGSFITLPRALDVYGAELESPCCDPLPSLIDDPAVIDFESDGHPGLTADVYTIFNGQVYVVMRLWRSLSGEFVEPGRIAGEIASEAQMNTLDADPKVLLHQLPLIPVDDPQVNRFEFVRLSREITCEELKANAGTLFRMKPAGTEETP